MWWLTCWSDFRINIWGRWQKTKWTINWLFSEYFVENEKYGLLFKAIWNIRLLSSFVHQMVKFGLSENGIKKSYSYCHNLPILCGQQPPHVFELIFCVLFATVKIDSTHTYWLTETSCYRRTIILGYSLLNLQKSSKNTTLFRKSGSVNGIKMQKQ